MKHVCIIQVLKEISEHGISTEPYTDNGPCYRSQQFSRFVKDFNFKHITSGPHYPQSNGFAERMVGTVKRGLKKCNETSQGTELGLLFVHTILISSHPPSPAEMLYNRPIPSILPTTLKFNQQHKKTKCALKQHQEMQRKYYDIGKRSLPTLAPGDPVMVQSSKDL